MLPHIHPFILTQMAVSAMQDAIQLVGSSQGEGVLLMGTSAQLGGAGDRTSDLAVLTPSALGGETGTLSLSG